MTFHYDEKSDVLYITFGEPQKCCSEEPESGLVIRKTPEGVLNGFTIIDFSKRTRLNPKDVWPKVYVLLSDDSGTLRSRPTPFGYAVNNKEEAKKFELSRFSYEDTFEELKVFNSINEALEDWKK